MSQNYLKRKGFRTNDSKFLTKKGRICTEVFADLRPMMPVETTYVIHAANAYKHKVNLRNLC